MDYTIHGSHTCRHEVQIKAAPDAATKIEIGNVGKKEKGRSFKKETTNWRKCGLPIGKINM